MILVCLDCQETPVTRAPPVLRVLRVNRDWPVCQDTRVIRDLLDLQVLKAPAGADGAPAVSPEAAIELSKSTISTSGDPVTVRGSGFLPGEPVVLQLRVDENLSIIAGGARGAQVQANEAGAFSITFDEIGGASASQARAVGDRTFYAGGSDGSRASVPVTVVASPLPVTAVDTSLLASATPVGESIMVWGAGFMPNEVVSLIAVGAAEGWRKPHIWWRDCQRLGCFLGRRGQPARRGCVHSQSDWQPWAPRLLLLW